MGNNYPVSSRTFRGPHPHRAFHHACLVVVAPKFGNACTECDELFFVVMQERSVSSFTLLEANQLPSAYVEGCRTDDEFFAAEPGTGILRAHCFLMPSQDVSALRPRHRPSESLSFLKLSMSSRPMSTAVFSVALARDDSFSRPLLDPGDSTPSQLVVTQLAGVIQFFLQFVNALLGFFDLCAIAHPQLIAERCAFNWMMRVSRHYLLNDVVTP